MATFIRELTTLINKHSLESGSDTPDFILAEYLVNCLENFNNVSQSKKDYDIGTVTELNKTTDLHKRI